MRAATINADPGYMEILHRRLWHNALQSKCHSLHVRVHSSTFALLKKRVEQKFCQCSSTVFPTVSLTFIVQDKMIPTSLNLSLILEKQKLAITKQQKVYTELSLHVF